jgi:hypothetical protein
MQKKKVGLHLQPEFEFLIETEGKVLKLRSCFHSERCAYPGPLYPNVTTRGSTTVSDMFEEPSRAVVHRICNLYTE